MKTKGQSVLTGMAIVVGSGMAAAVMVEIENRVGGGAAWGYPLAMLAQAAVLLGIIRLALGRLPLRPWVRRMWGQEQ